MELKKSSEKRKAYLKFPKRLIRYLMGGFIIVFTLALVIRPALHPEMPQILVYMFEYLLVPYMLYFLPVLILLLSHWGMCAGRSQVQTLYLYDGSIVYSCYNGKWSQRDDMLWNITDIDKYKITDRTIFITGPLKFTRTQHGISRSKTVHLMWIPRTFEDDSLLIEFIKKNAKQGC